MKRSLTIIALAWLVLAPLANAAGLRWYRSADWGSMRREHAGQAWVVHLWGMSCDPCRRELPVWGRFVRQHPQLPVTFIEVEPADSAAVGAALERAGLRGGGLWASADGFDEGERYAIDPRWGGELPLTLLIAPDGHVEPIAGTVDFGRLDAWAAKEAK